MITIYCSDCSDLAQQIERLDPFQAHDTGFDTAAHVGWILGRSLHSARVVRYSVVNADSRLVCELAVIAQCRQR